MVLWFWVEAKNFYVKLENRSGITGYFKCVSLRFILHGLFLMVAISFFFSSTSSISRAISPSDMDSSSSSFESELESDELEEKRQMETEKDGKNTSLWRGISWTKMEVQTHNNGLQFIYFTLQLDASLIDCLQPCQWLCEAVLWLVLCVISKIS